jgi:uncharacterized membrane protein YphA (DoxX/SURF4 family)
MNIDADGVLRIGLSLVYLWFGINQIADPTSFLGFPPAWILLEPAALVFFNGVFETITATLLLFGVFNRVVAGLLGLHMVGIIVAVGYNPVAVRDFGLLVGLIAVMINGSDTYSLWSAD